MNAKKTLPVAIHSTPYAPTLMALISVHALKDFHQVMAFVKVKWISIY